MGIVVGPFDRDDWFMLGQYKLDLKWLQNKLKTDKSADRIYAERFVKNKFKEAINRRAA